MCGGTALLSSAGLGVMGLSPRLRGNLHHADQVAPEVRSIPACAGEPALTSMGRLRIQVYPRVCGGTAKAPGRKRTCSGLSPRVRGNHGLQPQGLVLGGSIPACAGGPVPQAGASSGFWVYPRVCGGTVPSITRPHTSAGLSPRVRGNRQSTSAGCSQSGSIPACAGEPAHRGTGLCPRRVYPRVCGGTWTCPVCGRKKLGLSPRVRGNLTGHVLALRPLGSIPACTGEPLAAYRTAQLSGVYPRVYGGTLDLCANGSGYGGLSPRVRGNHHDGSVGSLETRSIPACAGEPRRRAGARRASGVYPRVYGGTRAINNIEIDMTGLSPRVRGNLYLGHCQVVIVRSIPAYAGNRSELRGGQQRHRSILACAGEPQA